MPKFKKILEFIQNTKQGEAGTLTVEFVLLFPMLFWIVTATFTYFDGFRQSAANLKAAYTIGDLISRETTALTDTYIDSMHQLMQRMVNNGTAMNLRVTLVVFDEGDDRHYVRWSTNRGFCDVWDDDNVRFLSPNLPPMPDQDTLIIVESSNEYEPVFNSIFVSNKVSEDHSFDNFVFTRPRFTNEVKANVNKQNCP